MLLALAPPKRADCWLSSRGLCNWSPDNVLILTTPRRDARKREDNETWSAYYLYHTLLGDVLVYYGA
jgi:hypothetical protein